MLWIFPTCESEARVPAHRFFFSWTACLGSTFFQWSCSRLALLTTALPKAVAGLWEKNSWESVSEQLLVRPSLATQRGVSAADRERKACVLLPMSAGILVLWLHHSHNRAKHKEMGNEISCLEAVLINIYKNKIGFPRTKEQLRHLT